jgi:hypothetical protein
MLYFMVRFKDKTDFSLRYPCEMFGVGASVQKLNRFPAKVYLHAGARVGARSLGLNDSAEAL